MEVIIRARLERLNAGSGTDDHFELNAVRVIVGTEGLSSKNVLQISGEGVKGKHAELIHEGEYWRFHPLEGAESWVNDKLVAARDIRLKDRDVLAFGSRTLRYRFCLHSTEPRSLPNGNEGKLYRETVSASALFGSVAPLGHFDLKDHCGTGLKMTYSGDQLTFEGILVGSGQKQLIVEVCHPAQEIEDSSGGRRSKPEIRRDKPISLFVNPDPRALWKEIEPADDLPFRTPHTLALRVDAKDHLIIAASRRGRSHAHDGTFREDDVKVVHDSSSGWSVMIVSDGAGSAKYSRQGSRLVCETAGRTVLPLLVAVEADGSFEKNCERYLNSDRAESLRALQSALYRTLAPAAKAAQKAIAEETGKIEGASENDFAATILLTIVRRYAFGTFVATFGIGDGGVGIYRGGDADGNSHETIVLNIPDGGAYAGQTRFITSRDVWVSGDEILRRIRFDVVGRFTAVLSMTDGVSDPKFQTDDNFRDSSYWSGLWEELRTEIDFNGEKPEQQLLEWLNFWSRGNHDDRTLAILVPR